MVDVEAKLTSKGQITLPLRVRNHLGVGPGDSVVFVEGKDGKISVRSRSGTLGDMRGMLRSKARLPNPKTVAGWIDDARSRSFPSKSARVRKRP